MSQALVALAACFVIAGIAELYYQYRSRKGNMMHHTLGALLSPPPLTCDPLTYCECGHLRRDHRNRYTPCWWFKQNCACSTICTTRRYDSRCTVEGCDCGEFYGDGWM